MAAAVAARMTGGEQCTRHIRRLPRRDIGNDTAAIFVRPDIEDRDVALAEQAAQGIARGFRYLLALLDLE